jgi:hypothetical protein
MWNDPGGFGGPVYLSGACPPGSLLPLVVAQIISNTIRKVVTFSYGWGVTFRL